MFNYSITTNEDKTTTKQTWESNGYTLDIITLALSRTRVVVSNPMDAPSIFVNDFGEEKTVVVNWSALGNTDPDRAGEYAAMIATASEVAKGFQQIINAM